MVSADDVINLCKQLSANGIQIWVIGGWGVDALLGEQTRPHKDLDILMLLDDVVRLRELLSNDGYRLKELWSENRWAIDTSGERVATAFVLHDSAGREIDAHAMRLDEHGNGIPMWGVPAGFIFTRQALAAQGMIAGFAVQCIAPEMQMVCHTGYTLPESHVRDLERLHDRFGVNDPNE